MQSPHFTQRQPREIVEIPERQCDRELEELVRGLRSIEPTTAVSQGGGGEPDAPFDLRVNRPCAIDLSRLWTQHLGSPPTLFAAALGPRSPILLVHAVTPFPNDFEFPGRVLALGYEMVTCQPDSATTVSVLPNDEVLALGRMGQSVRVGLGLGGEMHLSPQSASPHQSQDVVSVHDLKVSMSTEQTYQFELELQLSLTRVIGASVGTGGAVWKMYRQDKSIQRPHILLQTMLVPKDTKTLSCTVKTWASRAGLLGSRIRARHWSYDDVQFVLDLAGLDAADGG